MAVAICRRRRMTQIRLIAPFQIAAREPYGTVVPDDDLDVISVGERPLCCKMVGAGERPRYTCSVSERLLQVLNRFPIGLVARGIWCGIILDDLQRLRCDEITLEITKNLRGSEVVDANDQRGGRASQKISQRGQAGVRAHRSCYPGGHIDGLQRRTTHWVIV